MTEAETFGQTLRDLRERRGITQEGVARAAGLTTNYVSDVERGKKSVGLETILRLAYALDCAPSELFIGFTPAYLKRLFRTGHP